MNDADVRPLILDFGMHLGEDSEFYLALGARVISFEANGALVDENRARFRQELDSRQLAIVEGAVTPPGYAGETVTFYVDRNKTVWGTTKDDWVRRNASLGTSVDRVVVPAVDLAAILLRNDVPYYAKIDIEGADQDVLATLLATRICPTFLSIESSKLSLDDVAAEIDLLRRIGYTGFAAVQQGTVPGSVYRGPVLHGRGNLRHRFRRHASGRFGPLLRQEYKTAGAVMDDYARIFRRYALFGDTSWLMRNRYARLPTRGINRLATTFVRQPLCGWYDTHACR